MASEEAKIFFSYARREDGAFALKLARDLRAVGVSIWMDQLDIPTGVRWDRAIEQALKSCKGVLVILSPASVNNNNVMDEVSYALEEEKQILPVFHRTCTPPYRLRRLQYSNFTTDYESGFAQLLNALGVEQPLPRERASETLQETGLSDVRAHGRKSDAPPSKRAEEGAAAVGGAGPVGDAKTTEEVAAQVRPSTSILLRAFGGKERVWIGVSLMLVVAGLVLITQVLSNDGLSPARESDSPAVDSSAVDSSFAAGPMGEVPPESKEDSDGRPPETEDHTEGGSEDAEDIPQEPAESDGSGTEGEGDEEPAPPIEDDVEEEPTEEIEDRKAEDTPSEEPAPSALDVLHSDARTLQDELERAVEDNHWLDMPLAITDYYKKQIDRLRQNFDIRDVSLDSLDQQSPKLHSGGSTATMSVTLRVSYVQLGHPDVDVKEIPIQTEWTWEKRGNRFVLVDVQGVS